VGRRRSRSDVGTGGNKSQFCHHVSKRGVRAVRFRDRTGLRRVQTEFRGTAGLLEDMQVL